MLRHTLSQSEPFDILIAEDSLTQAEELRYVLETHGYHVRVARNGAMALEAARAQKPHLILSDIVMPEMDGYRLCKEIKNDPNLKDVPVILVTTLTGPHDVVRGLESGADSFIRKPYDEQYLITRIEYLRANRLLRSKDQSQMGLEIVLGGRRHYITSERQQILDLLISTYDEAIRLEGGLQHSYQSLSGLYHIADGLLHAGSEKEVCEIVLERALSLPGVQSGWILLRDGETEVRVAASTELSEDGGLLGLSIDSCTCCRKLFGEELGPGVEVLPCERLQVERMGSRAQWYHASVPLWVGNQVLGVMNLVGPNRGDFRDEDLKMLHSVGNQVGVALERAFLRANLERLVEERTAALTAEIAERKRAEEESRRHAARAEALLEAAQRRQSHLEALHTIDQAIIEADELSAVLETVSRQVVARLGVDAVRILCVDAESNRLRYGTSLGISADALAQPSASTERTLAEHPVAREQRTLVIANLAESEEGRQVDSFAGEGFVAYIGVPLTAQGRLNGVLEVYQRSPLDPDEEWFTFLEALALQTAIALDHVELLTQTRRLLLQTQADARQLAQVMETVPEGMIFLDSQQRILLANARARSYLPLLVDDPADPVLTRLGNCPIGDLLATVQPSSQWHEVLSDDQKRIFELATGAVRDDSTTDGWVLVLREVTEERQRRQYLQVQERMATVGQLATGIAHDFNNILTPILLYSDLSLNLLPPESRVRSHLTRVLEAANRAKSLVGQILAFGRQNPQQRKSILLQPIVREALRLMRAVLPTTIEIQQKIDPAVGPVHTDPTQIHQVIMNLCTNAHHAMREQGGTLTISLDSVEVGGSEPRPGNHHESSPAAAHPNLEPGRYARLTVSDTGPGMERTVLERIFEPFFTTKGPGEGTGMGLSVVYGIVTSHGGAITVESAPGQGATFVVYLPEVLAPADGESNEEPPVVGGKERILLVDDERAVADATAAILERLGYAVTAMTSSVEALARFRQDPARFDLVLTDLTMPGMKGTELAREIRRLGVNIPVVLVSGTGEAPASQALQDYGLHSILFKPFSIRELGVAIRRALDPPEGAETG